MRIGLSLGLTQPLGKGTPAVPAKTEADWKAHLLTITPQGDAVWGQLNTSVNSGLVGDYRLVAAVLGAGSLRGTPHLNVWKTDSNGDKLAIHALPDRPTFDDQSANARHMFVRFEAAADTVLFASLNRNGYTSSAFDGDPDAYPARRCTLIRWWDQVQLKVLQRNPFTNSATTEYLF